MGGFQKTVLLNLSPGLGRVALVAFSRAPPPRRGQQNLLGFMCMSSGQRFSLEQLMVKSGRLEPEQTLNHRAWGPLSPGPLSPGGGWCGGGGGGGRRRGSGSPGPLLNKENSETWA